MELLYRTLSCLEIFRAFKERFLSFSSSPLPLYHTLSSRTHPSVPGEKVSNGYNGLAAVLARVKKGDRDEDSMRVGLDVFVSLLSFSRHAPRNI